MKIILPADIPTHARCANCQHLVPVESMVEERAGYICQSCFDVMNASEPSGFSASKGALTALILAISGLISFWWGVHSIGLFIILSIGFSAGSVLQAVELKRQPKPLSGGLVRLAANTALWLSGSMVACMLLYVSISLVRFLQHPC